jgi:tricorn protease
MSIHPEPGHPELGDTVAGYLRLPSISGDVIVFVTEDDLWSVPAAGGQARRLTADLLGIGRPVLSPDGRLVAFTSELQGQPDVYVVPATGGSARRLTWLGAAGSRLTRLDSPTKVLAWAPDGRVVFATDAGQPFSGLTMAYAISAEPISPGAISAGVVSAGVVSAEVVSAEASQVAEPLPYGPVRDASFGPGGGVVIGRHTADPALWKRYRGGRAGAIWIDVAGNGAFEPLLRPDQIGGNLASPMWVGDRIYFLSDHEGIGNLYSCSLSGTDITRHTDHAEHYARLAASDGQTIVYQVAGRLWAYDPATDRTREVPVEVGSPRAQRQPRFVPADHYLGHFQLDRAGKRLVLDSRGKLFSLAPFEGPVLQHGLSQGARYRLASFLGDGSEGDGVAVVTISDASGKEAIEIHRPLGPSDVSTTNLSTNGRGGPARQVLDVPGLGRAVEMVPSPDGTNLAVTNHQHQLLLVSVESGESRVLDESAFGRPAGPTWSPDGKWVAYSFPGRGKTAQIKLVGISGGTPVAVTEALFRDMCPSFDPTGKYLYFLSWRTFDPVYDSLFFDLGFPRGARPYLVTLQADLPSPWLVRPEPAGEHHEGGERANGASGTGAGAVPPGPSGSEERPAPFRVDDEGIQGRVLQVPVPEARYEALIALKDKVLLLSRPIEGALGRYWAATGAAANGTLEWYDLVEDRRETLATEVAELAISGDRDRLAYTTGSEGGHRLRVVASSEKPDKEHENDPPGRASGFVDLGRIRVLVDPGAEWAQMLQEAWRLQPDQFWTADLSGVDWQRVLDRYLPLVDRVATRTELSDLIWELQGELGTSHAYEFGGEYRDPPDWGQAHLGADFGRDSSGRWAVTRIVPGSSWLPGEASPLLTPGADIGVGTVVLAVNGQLVDPAAGLGPPLANQAGQPVQLTVINPAPPGSSSLGSGDAEPRLRTIVVPTLADDRPLRYREWVAANRARVHEATGGRAGYLHVPDMMAFGWSEFHRSYQVEVERDALVVDARFNGGGHTSGLVLEKLARRRIAWELPRRGAPIPYPDEAPRGPLVLVTNESAGSDGDIFTHGFKLLGLGPVVGTRTWGGVIGIDVTLALVDGSVTTQPEYAFWFEDVGWKVENHGAEPDEEVVVTPQDYAAGQDPQLQRAIELVLEALDRRRPARPDFDNRPVKQLPTLPARKSPVH